MGVGIALKDKGLHVERGRCIVRLKEGSTVVGGWWLSVCRLVLLVVCAYLYRVLIIACFRVSLK